MFKNLLRQQRAMLLAGGLLGLGLAAQLGLAACGGSVERVTPTPTRTLRPPSSPTPAWTPTATPMPPTATPVSTPTPTPDAALITDFAPDVNPLTGLRVADPSVLERRPLAIKISNAPAVVRPQSGLSFADLVFEHYAEGGVTRFTAVFLSQGASQVGSIRSGRLIDLEIPAMYKAMFAYSGSSDGVKKKIVASDLFQENRIISPDFGVGEPYFYRITDPNKAYEHTLFTNTELLWQLTEARGLNARQDLQGLAFRETPPAHGRPARYVEIPYLKDVASAEWTYDPASGLYARSILGEPHTDALTGQQITAANVIIVYAHHQETDILEDLVGGGHYSIEIQIWGEGPVQIVRDGQVFDGRWERWAREDMLTFVDEAGNPLPLKPGNSWFQIVPLGFATIIN